MSRPRYVLHVLNSATGGAALSTLGIMGALRGEGIRSCAVCHDAGSPSERQQLLDATDGAVSFTRLYWWNRRLRMPLWRRPLAQAKQIVTTGWLRGSASRVTAFAERQGVDLIHTNTILTPEGGLAAGGSVCPTSGTCAKCSALGNRFGSAAKGPRSDSTWPTTVRS